jgi:hypothetical protein
MLLGKTGPYLLSFVGGNSGADQTPKTEKSAAAWGAAGLPSWVLNLATPVLPKPLQAVTSPKHRPYETATTLSHPIEFPNGGRKLLLKDKVWNTVASVGDDYTVFNPWEKANFVAQFEDSKHPLLCPAQRTGRAFQTVRCCPPSKPVNPIVLRPYKFSKLRPKKYRILAIPHQK